MIIRMYGAKHTKLEECTYIKGKKHGPCTYYHENGVKKIECTYFDNFREGPYVTYHNNGYKQCEGHYKRGQKHGLFNYWKYDGSKCQEIEYDMDDMKSSYCVDCSDEYGLPVKKLCKSDHFNH